MRSLLPVVSIVAAATLSSASAQTWPAHPITIVAPTTAGGPPDTIARILSEPMKSSLGQPVISCGTAQPRCTISSALISSFSQ